MPHWRMAKLVRDSVEKHVPGFNPEIKYERISDQETFRKELRRKLGEETIEYLIEPDNENELADVLDIVLEIARYEFAMDPDQLFEIVKKKRRRIGGFKIGMGMYVLTLDREEFDKKMKEAEEAGK